MGEGVAHGRRRTSTRDTAYAAVNTLRLDDLRPHIYRTHDGGKTWTQITTGIPDGGHRQRRARGSEAQGLLFAGTEQAVYVSFDDGDHWQSLRLNMPATSIRDLDRQGRRPRGRHARARRSGSSTTSRRCGRSTPATVGADAYLFKPQEAWRVRWNMNTDTPLPPDEPAGQNPPDGAIINYWLKARRGAGR